MIQAVLCPSDPDLIKSVRICAPAFETLGRLSADKGCVADQWIVTPFLVNILPTLRDGYLLAASGNLREVCELDQRFAASMDASTSSRLAGSGRRLLSENLPPKGERLLIRYGEHVQNGRAPGHFPVVFAVRAAVFHIPLRQAIIGYLYLEGRNACLSDQDAEAWIHRCMTHPDFSASLSALSLAA